MMGTHVSLISGSFCQRKEDKESSNSPAGNGKMDGEDPLITINEQTLDLDHLGQEDQQKPQQQQSPFSNDKNDITATLDSNV